MLGISPDKPEKLAKFRERDGLTITLLSDADKAAMKEAPSGRRSYGKVVEGVIRSTVVVDEAGAQSPTLGTTKANRARRQAAP